MGSALEEPLKNISLKEEPIENISLKEEPIKNISLKEEPLKNASLKEEWLEKAISDEYINEFDYNKFTDMKEIGRGGFGIVFKCVWEECKLTVALKGLKNLEIDDDANQDVDEKVKTNQEFVKELRMLQKIGFHPNIIQFYGVTKHPTENYKVILQFAEGGDLQNYLVKNFSKLNWDDKLRIAGEITLGLLFLHANNIIHLDLHSKNILVHKGKMMISDFGLSKRLDKASGSRSIVYGQPAYIDPQCYRDDSYKRNKKSDIYSLGFILWEITSGRAPFRSLSQWLIVSQVYTGKRETPIEDTPREYVALYKRCWDEDPENRPETRSIHDILECFISRKELSDLQKQTIQAVGKKAEHLTAANANIPSM